MTNTIEQHMLGGDAAYLATYWVYSVVNGCLLLLS